MSWLKRLLGIASKPAVLLPPEQAERLQRWRDLPPADMNSAHYKTRYVVVDVEASGLHMGKDRLISIGAVAVVNGCIAPDDAFEVILRQDKVSDHANILIHGIGGSAQRDGVDPAEALLAFLDYLGKAPLVAYHALFDQTMICRAMQEYLGEPFALPWIDLAWVMPELFREQIDAQVGLDDWLKLFGIGNILRHNAVSDAYATAMLLQAALSRASQRSVETPDALAKIEKLRRWLLRSSN